RARLVENRVELRDHTIGVDRRFIGTEARLPLLACRLLDLLDLRCDRAIARLSSTLPSNLFDELAEHKPRVPDDGLIDLIVAIQIAAIDGHLHHALTLRDWGRKTPPRKAAGNPEDQVGLD